MSWDEEERKYSMPRRPREWGRLWCDGIEYPEKSTTKEKQKMKKGYIVHKNVCKAIVKVAKPLQRTVLQDIKYD